MRVVTWNLNTPFTSAEKRIAQWEWLEREVNADVVVLTEAQVPKDGLSNEWSAIYKQDGIGDTRRWGTIIAARNFELRDVTNGDTGRGGFLVTHTWPGTVVIADVLKNGKLISTVVGIYSMNLTMDGKKTNNGYETTKRILQDLQGLFGSTRAKKLILMGDLNLFPDDVPWELRHDLYDMVEETAHSRHEYGYCDGCPDDVLCGHMWTHKNRQVPHRVQNLDYAFVSKKMRKKIISVMGGDRDFPEAWSLSDHAPVVLDLSH